MTSPPTDDIVVRRLDDPAELRAAAHLYRGVFGYVDTVDGVNPRLLAALSRNGGSVVGAFAGDELVGFAYGFAAVDPAGAQYQYSQAAVVARRAQGGGVGRRLKRVQAEIARAAGARSMRWAFDPVQSRNAHFNLDVLGARGRWLEPDLYGPGTDRMVVEWSLVSEAVSRQTDLGATRVPATAARLTWGEVVTERGDTWLAVPAEFDVLAVDEPGRAADVRKRVRVGIEELFAGGSVAVGCSRFDDETSLYRFAPAGDDREEGVR